LPYVSAFVDESGNLGFTTDGLPAYNEAFKKEFYHTHNPRPVHIRHLTFNGRKHNNHLMERLNDEIRDREKTFRGLKKDDTPILRVISYSITISGLMMGLKAKPQQSGNQD
jgi:transposase-like protein